MAVFVGQSTLQSDEPFPVEDENVMGICLRAIDPESYSIGAEMGYNYRKGSNNDESIPGQGTFDFRSRTDEVYFGLWAPLSGGGFCHPYVGAGIACYSIRAHQEGTSSSSTEEDLGCGAYAHVGVLFDVIDHLQWGIDLRGVLGNELNLFGIHTFGDYTQAALTVVYGF